MIEEVKKMIEGMTEDERDDLRRYIDDYEDSIKPRYSCKRGDVVRFWSEWRDYGKGIYKKRIERIAIALDDCNRVTDSTMLEYLGKDHKCWRYEPVRGDRFIEVIGHVDLSEWEAYTDKLWEEVYNNE